MNPYRTLILAAACGLLPLGACAATVEDVAKTAAEAINAVNGQGKTPLMLAAAKGSVEELQKLIAAGADINAKDKDGKTALDYATENGAEEAVSILKAAADGTLPPAEDEDESEEE